MEAPFEDGEMRGMIPLSLSPSSFTFTTPYFRFFIH